MADSLFKARVLVSGLILLPIILVVIPANPSPAVQAATRPNVVVIMADDMPPLDGRLARQLPNIRNIFINHGVSFADFHSESPLCCPARAGFLTDQHTHNHGVTQNFAGMFNPVMSLATQLHSAAVLALRGQARSRQTPTAAVSR